MQLEYSLLEYSSTRTLNHAERELAVRLPVERARAVDSNLLSVDGEALALHLARELGQTVDGGYKAGARSQIDYIVVKW